MSVNGASDTRAFSATLPDVPSTFKIKEEVEGGIDGRDFQRRQDESNGLGIQKRDMNGYTQDASRRAVSEDLGSRALPEKKRTNRYSSSFLRDSLSSLSRKRRKQDAAAQDAAAIQAGTAPGPRMSMNGTPTTSIDAPSSRLSEPSSAPTSSARASTSDRTTTPELGNGYLSPPRSAKGKERASSPIGEGTSWSMNSPRTSIGTDPGRPGGAQHGSPYAQPMDPTTLVQLALNLSQSRRMNLAPGQLAQNNVAPGLRNVPASHTLSNEPARSGSVRGANQYNRMSTASMDERLNQKSSLESAHSAAGNIALREDAPFQASASTLARAAKAQAFFQLASEYRRLLQFLPPLKPRRQLGEDTQLGRAYNPLQYIRNKQVRSRRREGIDNETTGWAAADRVGVWVDMIEVDAQFPEFWSGDLARLQRYTPPGRHRASSTVSSTAEDTLAETQQKSSGIIDWSFKPSQLLADAYWLEQGSHKTLIETRDGKSIFDSFEPPQMDAIEEDTWQTDKNIADSPLSMTAGSPVTRRRRSSVLGNGRRSFSPQGRSSDDNDMSAVGFSPITPIRRKRGLPGRLLRHHRAQSAELTDDSGSDHERRLTLGAKGSPKYNNTGPLQKQMQKLIEREAHNKPTDNMHDTSPIEQSNSRGRRAAVSNEHHRRESNAGTDHGKMQSLEAAQEAGTPRISVSDFETGTSVPADDNHSRSGSANPPKRHRRGSIRNFFHKQSSEMHEEHKIEATDFALINQDNRPTPTEPTASDKEPRKNSQHDTRHQPKRSKSGSDEFDPASATGMFFKVSRLGDVVRKERPRMSDFIRRTVRNGSVSASDAEDSRQNGLADTEDDTDDERLSSKARNHSSIGSAHGYYGTHELPTFRSTRAKDEEPPRRESEDHIRRQSEATKNQRRHSRFEENKLTLNTNSDISPSTSNVDLSRFSTNASNQRGRQKDRYGRTLSTDNHEDSSRSRSPAIKGARRLNSVLETAGAVGPEAGLPVTGLGKLMSQHSRHSSGRKSKHTPVAPVTAKDIAHLRAELTLTAIKAQAVLTRANTVRDPVPAYILEAASLSHAALAPVTRRQEHVLAASLLAQTLEETIEHVTENARHFRNDTCSDLHKRLDELRETLTDSLMPALRTSSDEADAFVAQLTTTHTLSIKQVNDAVDALVRNRRRRLRLLRNVGFKGLEWVVVCVLWIVWLVVSVLRVVRIVVVGVGRGVRWAFWAS